MANTGGTGEYAIRKKYSAGDEASVRMSNYFMLSQAGSPTCQKIIDLVVERSKFEIDMDWNYDVIFTTGPDVVSEVISKNCDMGTFGVPAAVLGVYSWHNAAGSWKGPNGRLYSFR